MFSWLIPSGPFINKCLRTETGIDACAYFINETRQYGKLLFNYYLYRHPNFKYIDIHYTYIYITIFKNVMILPQQPPKILFILVN